jgi:hypothetical protein
MAGVGVNRVSVMDWRSVTSGMRFWSIDEFFQTLNVLIDELGRAIDLIGD